MYPNEISHDRSPESEPAFPCAAVIPTGASEVELQRLEGLLESLAYHEPHFGPVCILNDGAPKDHLERLLAAHGVRGFVLPHPRAGIGNSWLGRITSGLTHAYLELAREFPGSHILKLDTDALITAPFSSALGRLVQRSPDAGMIGSVGLTPQGGKSGNWFGHRIYRMGRRFARWDQPPHFRLSLFGARAQMRKLVRTAYENGYEPDVAPCGGAYLLTAEAVRRMRSVPALFNVEVAADEALAEDVFFSIVVYAVGLTVVEQNSAGDVFGVCWKGLPGSTLASVAERRNAIIHSVKDHAGFRELETRDFFRAARV